MRTLFEVHIDISENVYSFWFVRGVLRTVSNVFDRAFLENEGWYLAVKNSLALRHYPGKIKCPQNIFKIYLKKEKFLCNPRESLCKTRSQNMTEDWHYKNIYISCNLIKVINKTNPLLPSLKPTLFKSSTLRASAKVCGNLISKKMTSEKCYTTKSKCNESQLARESPENLRIRKSAVSDHHTKKNNWLIKYFLQCMLIEKFLFNDDSRYLPDIKTNKLIPLISQLCRN